MKRIMKRVATFILTFLFVISCSQKMDGPSSGEKIGEIYVSAQSGKKSILVNIEDRWRVESQSEWIKLDVNGRNGKGAFTLYYSSNESSISRSNPTRRGSVVVERLSANISDTLYVIQQGIPDGVEYTDLASGSYIEYEASEMKRMKVCYANVQGGTDENISSFINNSDADVLGLILSGSNNIRSQFPSISFMNMLFVNKSDVVMDSVTVSKSPVSLIMSIDGINYQISDFFDSLPSNESRLSQAINMLDVAYKSPGLGNKWVLGGSFYYNSVLESNYSNTPAWYPSNPKDSSFAADLYVQNNSLVDCVWSSSRRYNATYSFEGKEWRADYMYASPSIWNSIIQVSLKDASVQGANHKQLEITLKY